MTSLLFIVSLLALWTIIDSDSVIQMKKPAKKRDMNVFHNICLRDRGGKLEDWMFQYASLHGLAKNKRMTAEFDSVIFNKLKAVFKFPERLIEVVDVDKCKDYDVVIDKRHSTFDRGFVQFIEGTDPVLLPNAYLHSWFYFYNCIKPIRREFVLVDSLIAEAKQVLEAAADHARKNSHLSSGAKPTYIGLVVNRVKRGIDYRGNDAIVPTARYYRAAMDFFETNFDNIIYMVYADNVEWARQNLQGGPFVFMESQVDELVLAVMAGCQHMIISPGAFSFWAAFLANGETVYYKETDETVDTEHYSYHKMDYYLPYWRPMEYKV